MADMLYLDMNYRTRKLLREHARENGYPMPGSVIPILSWMIVKHKLSLIAGEIDATVDRICLLHDRMKQAIEDGSVVGVALIKERLEEEKKKLRAQEKLLQMEGPMFKQQVNSITDEMIARAKDYPFESLLPEELKRGRCRCPIHSGANTMSFSVKDNRGKCFSCGWPNGKAGDPIQFLMDTQSLSFPEAVRKLQ